MRQLLLLAAIVAGGCSSTPEDAMDGGGAGACPDDVPRSCPTVVPSYTKDIAPILERSCVPCHQAGGSAGFPETTYGEVSRQASPILDQVSGCLMPPNTYPITTQERVELLGWLVCGAPDN